MKIIYDPKVSPKKYLYRYATNVYSSIPPVVLEKYLVLEETEYTYIIDCRDENDISNYWEKVDRKRCFKKARRSFAHETEEVAKINYEKRTEKYIQILKNRLNRVEFAFDYFLKNIKR